VPAILVVLMNELGAHHQELQIIQDLREKLAIQVTSRFHHLISTVNGALLAAAVHPMHGHLSFISVQLRDEIWEKVDEWCAAVYETNETHGPIQLLLQQQRKLILNFLRTTFESLGHQQAWPFPFVYGNEIQLETLKNWSNFYEDDEESDKVYVIIHKLIKMLMALPCTSAPAERVFSCTSFLKPPLRNRLGSELLEFLTVIRSFIHSPLFNFEEVFQHFVSLIRM